METGSNSELRAFAPDRVVIKFAVEPEHVEPFIIAWVGLVGADGPPDKAGHHRHFQPKLTDRVLQFINSFLRSMHWNDRSRCYTIFVLFEHFRGELVERAAEIGRA